MRRKQWRSGVMAVWLFVWMLSSSGCTPKTGAVITDASGEQLAMVKSTDAGEADCPENGYQAYAEAAVAEALDILCTTQNCSREKAETLLLSEGYTIQTAFDKQVFQAASAVCREEPWQDASFGVAVTDLKGRLLAIVSNDTDPQAYDNHALKQTYPGSTLKPLSVYAPAVEQGLLQWSTMVEDAPVKQITADNGMVTDWPANANGVYTRQTMSVCEAIKQSTNTVAVRCLQQLGAERSLDFLNRNFEMDLRVEEDLLAGFGQDEVLGNLALGYLRSGVSAVDMAGYYQIFATGGMYTKPYAVLAITDAEGNPVYTAQPQETRVLQETTAFVMNRLLQQVVSVGGTGAGAQVDGVTVAGKTGTSENNQDNWFVGVTPQYSCAVWHDDGAAQNQASAAFRTIVSALDSDSEREFPACSGVTQKAYCNESGYLLSASCSKMEVGYFVAKEGLAACRQHTAHTSW